MTKYPEEDIIDFYIKYKLGITLTELDFLIRMTIWLISRARPERSILN